LRPLPYREVRRKLEAAGFRQVSQTGSHVKYVRLLPGRALIVIVPRHRTVAAGTVREIAKQAGLTPQEFDAL
jgi:predicted RNA binding protein YcfA (HicA-like mRNA interferase family)